MRVRIGVAMAAAMASIHLVACGSRSESAQPVSDSEAAAVTVCTEANLTRPNGICDGPWEYRYKCVPSKLNSYCKSLPPLQYSDAGVAAPAGDIDLKRCLTADDVADPAGKFVMLVSTLNRADARDGYFSTNVDIASLRSTAVAKLELLLELHGDALTSDQRAYIQRLYGSRPELGPTCGTRAADQVTLPTSNPMFLGVPARGEVTSDGWFGAALDETMTFTVPAEGGVLSFDATAGYCIDPYVVGDRTLRFSSGASFSIYLVDQSTGNGRVLAAPKCPVIPKGWGDTWSPPSDVGKVSVSVDIGSMAGHAVTLHLVTSLDCEDCSGSLYIREPIVTSPLSLGSATVPIALCHRLSQDHVGQPQALASLDACLAGVNALTPTAGRKLLDLYLDGSSKTLGKAIGGLPETDPSARKQILQDRMALIQNWFVHARPLYPEDATARMWNDVKLVTSGLAKGAHLNSVDAIDVTVPGRTPATAAQFLTSGFAVDRELLDALLTNRSSTGAPPLTSAPALFVLADGLRPASERLGRVDYLHDLGCRFSTCTGGFSSEVSQMHALLGSLADATELTAARAVATRVRQEWKDAFATVQAAHASVIESAAADAARAPYNPGLILDAPASDAPAYQLSELISAERRKARSFAESGRFRHLDSDAIFTGLLRRKVDTLTNDIDTAQAQLQYAVSHYEGQRNTLLQAQLEYMKGIDSLESVTAQLQVKEALIKQVSEDVDGLRIAATVDRERFGDLGKALDEAIARLEPGPNEYVDRNYDGPFSVSAAQVTYHPGDTIDLGRIAVRGMRALLPGDLVRVGVSGSWSPTCAIRLAADKFTPPLQGWGNATTGSQGFVVQGSSGAYHVVGHTTEDYKYTEKGGKGCGGTSFSYSPNNGSAGGTSGGTSGMNFSFWGSGEACAGITKGHREVDVEQTGTEYRTTAVFNAGMRLPNTPFPEYPVGALLAVKVQAGQTSRQSIVDVEVVQDPASTIIISKPYGASESDPGAQDLYLVPNEVRVDDPALDPPCSLPAEPHLSVTLGQLRPKRLYALSLQRAMQKTYASIEKTIRETVLPQGRLLPEQARLITQEANTALLEECSKDGPCDLASYDKDLLQVYRTWVTYTLAAAERQVEINKLLRQLHVSTIEWTALAQEAYRIEQQNQVEWLLPAMTARNMDTVYMEAGTQAVAEVVDKYLYPFLAAKYPEALYGKAGVLTGILSDSYLQGSTGMVKGLTTDLDWAGDFTAASTAANNVVDRVQYWLSQAYGILTKSTETQGFPLTIVFRKPEVYRDPTLPPEWWDTNYDAYYREAAPERAERLWSALANNQAATLEILPEDLYQYRAAYDANGSPIPRYDNQLSCNFTVPVVRGIGFFVITDDDVILETWNGLGRWVNARSEAQMSYLGSSGPDQFIVANPSWTYLAVPVTYGTAAEAYSTFIGGPGKKPIEWYAAEGLSPFGNYAIEEGSRDVIDPVRDGVNRRAVALAVVMQVEIRDNGSSPAWIANCSQ